MTNKEIAEKAHVAVRTARAHTFKLVKLGLVDMAEVFPAHRFRWSQKSEKRNAAYSLRLQNATEVFAGVA